MKKFSKILALGMAVALVFGMSVSAAESKDTNDAVVEGVNSVIASAGVQDSNGNKVDVKVEATVLPETVYNEAFGTNYQDALAKVDANDTVNAAIDAAFATLGSNSNSVLHVYRDIIDVTVAGEIPAGGLYVPVLPAGDGEAYVVAHWNGTAWEVLKTKVENGAVYALFPQGFSPVFVSILTVTGEDQPSGDNNNNNNSSNSNNNSSSNNNAAPSSPKTGETLPVAGILAVICLAAAAVCAKKVRYNR